MTDRTIHRVRPGETLGKIANLYWGDAMLWSTLAEYNSLADANKLDRGQVLYIPEWIPQIAHPVLLDPQDTNYYRFGSIYQSGPWEGRPHPGWDIHEHEGAPVFSMGQGLVVSNDYGPYAGFYVKIAHMLHDGRKIYSFYGHLAEASPWNVGDQLINNLFIGLEGSTGTTLPHVHFEIRKKTLYAISFNQLTPENLDTYYIDPEIVYTWDRMFVPVSAWTVS